MGLLTRLKAIFSRRKSESEVERLSKEVQALQKALEEERRRRQLEMERARLLKKELDSERKALSEEVDRLLQATKRLHQEKMKLEREKQKRDRRVRARAAGERERPPQDTFSVEEAIKNAQLIGDYTFENYIVGPSNQFACDVARSVAESPSQAYNPLFIYGDVGLGKTHLINAIGNYILAKDPSKKVLYSTSEEFTNELIDAVQSGQLEGFRKKYRELDVLIVDDIQFISRGESTQEEFFHTFNALYKAHSQIVISSDRPPKEISTLEERLRSRFEGGLITSIQCPDYATRREILEFRVRREGLDIDEEVIDLIAREVESNVRTLNGALNKLVVYRERTGKPPTAETARMILADLLPRSKGEDLCPICRSPMEGKDGILMCPQCGHTQ